MIPSDKTPNQNRKPWEQRRQASSGWGDIIFTSLVGAAATTLVVYRLRRYVDWLYSQHRSHRGGGGFREDARNRYSRRMQEEYEDEMERVERIRRMQSVFQRERSKQKKSYETWRESEAGAYQSQHFQRDDWYWKTDNSYKDRRTRYRSAVGGDGNYKLSHHYSVLGLNRSRTTPYSEAEIKSAFREKAMKYHPDQNRNNKEAAEAKFKEVMVSYEAIKLDMKKGSS